MNIKEREQKLSQLGDLNRLAVENGQSTANAKIDFDWNKLIRPQVYSYLPPNAIQELNSIVSSARLMNKPTVKYDLVNKLLYQYGFRPLNSGTNRRTFYNVMDPGIVIKLASDRVGRSDNISEFNLQGILKPSCPKTFDVTPDGLVALVERVEPMSESEYKDIYGGVIFDIIYSFLREGYIMEDVGGNFYKNWGIRYGFGPVLLDYPYIYEIDWTKLKCRKVDPITNQVCNGWLDYDYDKGLSEIVCTKCGARYSAKSLAKLIPSKAFNNFTRKRDNKMALINVNLRGNLAQILKDGTKVSYRNYNESETRERPNKYRGEGNNNTVDNNRKKQDRREARKDVLTNAEISRDFLEFAYNMGSKYGWNVYKEFCIRVGISQAERIKFKEEKDEEYKKILNSEIHQEEEKIEEPKEEVEEEVSIEDKKMDSKMLDLQCMKNKYSNVNAEHNTTLEEIETRPTSGLFPMEPKTSKEIEEERLKSEKETAPYGLIGELGVEKVKRERLIPELQEYFKNNIDYQFIPSDDDSVNIRELTKVITEDIKDKLDSISTSDVNRKIEVTKGLDRRNQPCYIVKITVMGVTFMEYMLHPCKEEDEKENTDSMEVLRQFADELVAGKYGKPNKDEKIEDIKDAVSIEPSKSEKRLIDTDSMDGNIEMIKASNKFCFSNYDKVDRIFKTDLASFLIAYLMDKDKSIPYAKAMKISRAFVEEYYKDSDSAPKPINMNTVELEL